MYHSVSRAVEDIVADDEIPRRIRIAPALYVRRGVDIVPLLTPAEAREAEDIVLDHAAVDHTAVNSPILVEEVLDRINAIFDQIADVRDVLNLTEKVFSPRRC